MVKQRLRRWEALPPDGTILVRGDLLDPDILRRSAVENHEIYRFFGVSVFAETPAQSWEQVLSARRAFKVGPRHAEAM